MSRLIGKELADRMDSLGIDVTALSDMSFVGKDLIESILKNETSIEDVDEFDMGLICSVLHCTPEFFVDDETRKSDLLFSTMNRGNDSVKSRNVKARIQDYMNDFSFVNEVMSELE